PTPTHPTPTHPTPTHPTPTHPTPTHPTPTHPTPPDCTKNPKDPRCLDRPGGGFGTCAPGAVKAQGYVHQHNLFRIHLYDKRVQTYHHNVEIILYIPSGLLEA